MRGAYGNFSHGRGPVYEIRGRMAHIRVVADPTFSVHVGRS